MLKHCVVKPRLTVIKHEDTALLMCGWTILLLGVLSAFGTHGALADSNTQPTEANTVKPPVVLLHGLKRSRYSMRKIEKALSKSGYPTCNINYPTNKLPATELVALIERDIKTCVTDPAQPVNFVTHSMGGIMVRALAESNTSIPFGRVVMLAPPNQGSEIVDLHRSSKLFRWVMGDVATQLGTDVNSLPLRLGPARFDTGVIAGDGFSNPMGLWVFDEPSDGTVAVRSTRLEGMSDFIVVPYGHTLIMRKKAVIDEVMHYFDHGRFSPRFREAPMAETP